MIQMEIKEEVEMEDYQKRVVEEKDKLDAKIQKLTIFIDNKQPVSKSQAQMMIRQLVLMELYSQTLADRISLF